MKKLTIPIIIVIIALILIVTFITANVINNNSDDEEQEDHLIELSIDDLEAKINNKESFILVITQTTCSHCAEYKPILREVLAEYDLYAYFIEEDLLSSEELSRLKQIANANSTPTTIFITDGEEQSTSTRLVGTRSKTKIIEKLKQMNYIE